MKTFLYSVSALMAVVIVSCDYVNQPTSGAPTSTTTPTSTVTVRKVLLEDYTGHECGNCPAAARKAVDMENQYHDNIVVLAVHAGFFAEVGAAPFTNDFNTTAGTDWDNFFNISNGAGNPNGLVNRQDVPTNQEVKSYSSWPSVINPYINTPADAKLTITPTYNTSNRQLNVSVKTKFLNNLSNNYKLSVVVSEDSITGAQKDYTQNPSTINNYLFMHVLRGALNSSWGEALNTAPVAVNDSITKTYSAYAIDPAFNDNHMYVVAFVYNATTYEVIQVERIKMR